MTDGVLPQPEREDFRPFSPVLEDCIAAVVDGRPVDWEAVRRALSQPRDAARLDLLEALYRLGQHAEDPAEPVEGASDAHAAQAGGAELPLPFPRWGPLTLRRLLGTGAFGEVFLARDDALGRDVALKLFSPRAALSAGGAAALVREARRLAQVRQENIVDVYGADIHEARAGFWMEYVRGETLEQRLSSGGRFHAWEAIWVGMQLCRALSAIHAAGLLHLDVKASNVLREDGGRIVLTDFGAVVESDPRGAAAAALRMTTPLSAAPELLRGEPPSVPADVYALGVLLYRLVTGVHPVEGDTVDELRDRHVHTQPPRLREVRADLPVAFVGAVERALQAEPRARFASAAEMETALRQAATAELGLPISPPLPGPGGSTLAGAAPAPAAGSGRALRRWVRGSLALLGVAAATAAALRLLPGGRSSSLAYFREDFAAPDKNELLRHHWQLLHPDQEHWRLPHAQGRVTLYTLRGDLWTKDQEQPYVANMLARPFTRRAFRVTALLTDFNPRHNWQQAGVVLLDDADQYVRLTVGYDAGSDASRPGRITVGAVFEEEGTVVAQPIIALQAYTGQPLPRIWLQIAKGDDAVALRYRVGSDYGPFVELDHRPFRLKQKYVALAAFQGITQELPGGARQPLAWDPVPANFDYVSVEPLR